MRPLFLSWEKVRLFLPSWARVEIVQRRVGSIVGVYFLHEHRDPLAKFYLLDRRGRRRYMGNIDTVICQRGCITLVSSVLMRFVRSRPGTLNCRRRPADVVIEHKKRATAVWVVLLLSILGCKEYNVFMRIWSP